eukprot:258762-Hanusia_phi.AAC.4
MMKDIFALDQRGSASPLCSVESMKRTSCAGRSVMMLFVPVQENIASTRYYPRFSLVTKLHSEGSLPSRTNILTAESTHVNRYSRNNKLQSNHYDESDIPSSSTRKERSDPLSPPTRLSIITLRESTISCTAFSNTAAFGPLRAHRALASLQIFFKTKSRSPPDIPRKLVMRNT